MNLFIHSFIHIEHLYSAPSRKTTSVRLKRTVFKREKNERDKVLGKRRSSSGRPFQVEGPTTEKARFCLMEVRAKWRRSSGVIIFISRTHIKQEFVAFITPTSISVIRGHFHQQNIYLIRILCMHLASSSVIF